MDRDDSHAEWSPQEIAWDGLTLTANNSAGIDANVPTIQKYYSKGRGAVSSGSSGSLPSSSCRVPECTSDLSRDLAYFRKYRICREHLKSPVLMVEGVPSRFCQQCSRFHHVKEFDGPQRTCRAMLERLRLKRNSTKAQANGGNGGQAKNDTQPVDALQVARPSRSNSTSKDAEPLKDMVSVQPPPPPQQQQQHCPDAGPAASYSGEGVESFVAIGVTASRHGASAAPSIPGVHVHNQNHCYNQIQTMQNSLLLERSLEQQQALLHIRQRQTSQPQPPKVEDPRVASLLGAAAAPGASLGGTMHTSGGLGEQPDVLQLCLSQNNGSLHVRHDRTLNTTAAGLNCGTRRSDFDTMNRQDLPDSGGTIAPLYRDAPYGLLRSMSSNADGGGSGGSGNSTQLPNRPSGASIVLPPSSQDLTLRRLPEAAVAAELLSRRERETTRLQLAGSSRDDTAGTAAAAAAGYGCVLDLGQPSAAVGQVLNLGSRVDKSLELQLQAIYREMVVSDAAAARAAGRQPVSSTPPRQGVLSTVDNGALFDRSRSAVLPSEHPIPPANFTAASVVAAPRPPLLSNANFACFHQQLPVVTPAAAAAAALMEGATAQQQQQQQQQQAFSDLATAIQISRDCMDVGADHLPLPISIAGGSRMPSAGLAAIREGTIMRGSDPSFSLPQSRHMQPQQLQQLQQPQGQQQRWQQRQQQQQQQGVVGGSIGWCGSEDDIDAMLDMLMEEAGDGAVYHAGNKTASLERVCFKLQHLHPRDLPSDLMCAMGSWLAAARAEVVQGAVRPGCTQLILDVYANGPNPADLELEEEDEMGADAATVTAGDTLTNSGGGSRGVMPRVAFTHHTGSSLPDDPPQMSPTMTTSSLSVDAAEASLKHNTGPLAPIKGRVLGGLMPSENELAQLEAAAAAVGAEALSPISEERLGGSGGPSASAGQCRQSTVGGSDEQSTTSQISAYVMHNGNVRAAAACFKKLFGPRAVQSMSVSIRHKVLSISSREVGRYVTDTRGTLLGTDTPLLLSVLPLAVVAGVPTELNVIGSHLAGPGRRPQVRCQGAHLPCSVITRSPKGNGFRWLRPHETRVLADQVTENTLPGTHRAKAMDNCTTVELKLEVPDMPGLMMLEWEADRPGNGVAISDWLPLLLVPDTAMAVDINRLASRRGCNNDRFRSFLQDLGLVLDYTTRVSQRILVPILTLMTTEQESAAAAAVAVAVAVATGDEGTRITNETSSDANREVERKLSADGGGGGGGGGALHAHRAAAGDTELLHTAAPPFVGSGSSSSSSSTTTTTTTTTAATLTATLDAEVMAWKNRSCGGGDDQRQLATLDNGYGGSGGVATGADGVTPLEHDSRQELMGRPRLSKKHHYRVQGLAPSLLAFATDSGMPAVMSWLIDFMLEHVHFGELAAVFQCVESVGGSMGLPLLHRAVRSGNTGAVQLLLQRAASHGLTCNLAQPAGYFNITPLHLAALQPIQSGMLQACGCPDPAVAQLWATVTDAAGRTPATYLRRQLELLAQRGASATAVHHPPLEVLSPAAGPTYHRSSTPGTASRSAYRSWGSEESSKNPSASSASSTSTTTCRISSGVVSPVVRDEAVGAGDEYSGGDRGGDSGDGGSFGVRPCAVTVPSGRDGADRSCNGRWRDCATGEEGGGEGAGMQETEEDYEARDLERRREGGGHLQLMEARAVIMAIGTSLLAAAPKLTGEGFEIEAHNATLRAFATTAGGGGGTGDGGGGDCGGSGGVGGGDGSGSRGGRRGGGGDDGTGGGDGGGAHSGTDQRNAQAPLCMPNQAQWKRSGAVLSQVSQTTTMAIASLGLMPELAAAAAGTAAAAKMGPSEAELCSGSEGPFEGRQHLEGPYAAAEGTAPSILGRSSTDDNGLTLKRGQPLPASGEKGRQPQGARNGRGAPWHGLAAALHAWACNQAATVGTPRAWAMAIMAMVALLVAILMAGRFRKE